MSIATGSPTMSTSVACTTLLASVSGSPRRTSKSARHALRFDFSLEEPTGLYGSSAQLVIDALWFQFLPVVPGQAQLAGKWQGGKADQ